MNSPKSDVQALNTVSVLARERRNIRSLSTEKREKHVDAFRKNESLQQGSRLEFLCRLCENCSWKVPIRYAPKNWDVD